MKQPLVSPLDRNATPQAEEMARFYEETLGFTPGRVSSALKREIAYLSSMTTGCRYCEAHAIRAAERYGSSEDRMNHIWEYKTYAAMLLLPMEKGQLLILLSLHLKSLMR